LYIIKKKRGKPDRKPYPLPCGLRNPYRNLKSENSQDYAQKHQRYCMFMNSAFSGRYLDMLWRGVFLVIRLVGSNSAFSKQLIMIQQRKVENVAVVNGR
jgi:hypothetical protein